MAFRQPLILILIAALSAAGCVSTKTTKLGTGANRKPLPADQVAIYLTASQVTGKYEEVALLTSSGDSDNTSEAGMHESMRKAAGKVGANAIILDSMSEPTTGERVSKAFLGTSAERKGKAIAIYVYPDETGSNPPAAGNDCPFCHAANARGVKFCSSCGKKIEQPPPPPSSLYCPNCGKKIADNEKFCSQCGTARPK